MNLTAFNSYRKKHPVTPARLLACLALLLIMMPAPLAAKDALPESSITFNNEEGEQTADDIKTLQQEVKKQSQKIQRMQENIIEQKLKILDSKKKERSVLDELEKIDQRLRTQQETLAGLNVKLTEQETLLHQEEKNIGQLSTEEETLREHVKKRLAAYYRTGPIGLINIFFSTESLPGLINLQEYFRRLIQHDRDMIQTLKTKIATLKKAKEDHAEEKTRLLSMLGKVTEEKKNLSETQEGKKNLLQRVKTEKKLYERAADEIESAALDLAETIKNIRLAAVAGSDEEKEQPAVPVPAADGTVSAKPGPLKSAQKVQGFAARKGMLPPPVEGTVTTYFDPKQKDNFSGTSSTGISIKPGEDTQIRAIYNGRVINVGYLRGYGNLLILDHGDQYYSVMSQATKFFKKEGDQVSEGDVIGIMDETETLMGEGLHFEIRRGPNPLDPLQWLDPSRLQTTQIKIKE